MNEDLLLIGFVRPMRPICKKNQHVSVRFVFLTFVTLKIDGNLLFPAKKSKGHPKLRQPVGEDVREPAPGGEGE